jgi:hypothetical protein
LAATIEVSGNSSLVSGS